ncbi:unnamed protein product [marine sediment metagenome]|uniref:Uncharacterized protein n=1 Tax=marine sediment metagenome TaxID=412755 RepID=X1V6K5_9ZZZZ
MAKKPDPLASLTIEAREHIDAMEAELDRATTDLAALKELGLDVSRLEEKINWAKHAREVILKTFTP